MNIFVIIAIIFLIAVIGYWMGSRAPGSDVSKAHIIEGGKRGRQKARVLELFNRQPRVVNDDVQKLLEVSDSTATRVLQDLVDDGILEEHGETRGTYYTRR